MPRLLISLLVLETLTRRSGCGNGSGFNRTASIKLKIAVFVPMPKPRISTAMTVKVGDFNKSRTVYLRDRNKPRIVLGASTVDWQVICQGYPRCRPPVRSSEIRSAKKPRSQTETDHLILRQALKLKSRLIQRCQFVHGSVARTSRLCQLAHRILCQIMSGQAKAVTFLLSLQVS